MVINQGDIYWLDRPKTVGSEPEGRRPHVVIQNNAFNRSRLNTAVVCAITSNVQRASMPGNVQLLKGEANLPRPSVVNVTQIITVDRSAFQEYIGTLSPRRVREIVNGIRKVIEPREVEAEE